MLMNVAVKHLRRPLPVFMGQLEPCTDTLN